MNKQPADRALADLQTQHQLILDSAGEGVYGLNSDGNATFVNRAAQEILGWAAEDIVGESIHEFHHHSYADGAPYPREECPIYAAIKDGEVHRVDDEVFWHRDGRSIPVEYTSTPIWRDGHLEGAVVVFRDITQRKQALAQRQAAYDEVSRLKDQLEQERDYLRDEINITAPFGEIIGESEALKRTLSQVEAVAGTKANVLILGESGVGKEMIARAIHVRSDRVERPLVKVNCASIPKELFESEFFGHVKGAFTGAHKDRVGRLQLASGGTVFLDEIGEIPLDLQGKLLRALQEREFERVGDDTTIQVDVRVVAASNRDLEAEVRAGRFREDLYYRLSVFPLNVPPLRDRKADLLPLAVHFLRQICADLGRAELKLTSRDVKQLTAHDWPGNIRELRNVIERAVILSPANRLRLDRAMPAFQTKAVTPAQILSDSDDFLTYAELREQEKRSVTAALRKSSWRISGATGAAQALGIKPSTLSYRMKILGVRRED
jgi:PAS domain S-box-containing protein